MDRIRREVRNPRLQEDLVDDVESAEKLTNPEAAKIYSIERDKGPAAKFMRRLEITPHAQYRMDLRGVTIADVRLSLGNFARAFYDAKSRGDFEYQRWAEDMAYGRPIRWEDPKNARLVIVFTAHGRGTIRIVTVYWEGMSDPRPIDESACRVASMYLLASRVREALRMAPTPGVQTVVTDKSQKNLPTDVDREKQVVLPPGSATPGGAGRDIPQFSYNGPDSNSDIKPRTIGIPGEEYGHPSNDTYNTVTRRPMNASDRSALIRLASTFPVGSPDRKTILAGLSKGASRSPITPALAERIARKARSRWSDVPDTPGMLAKRIAPEAVVVLVPVGGDPRQTLARVFVLHESSGGGVRQIDLDEVVELRDRRGAEAAARAELRSLR
jgi:hypothetical protein